MHFYYQKMVINHQLRNTYLLHNFNIDTTEQLTLISDFSFFLKPITCNILN